MKLKAHGLVGHSENDLGKVFENVLVGTAVGDALGLPAENLSPQRIKRWWCGEWRMRLLFGRGMISDDTEHTLMVAQALLEAPRDATAFQKALAWKFRWWLAGLPGGVGLATAKACLRLWLGVPASRSAVNSAGSGPAMRSAIIGAFFASEPGLRRDFVLASSRLTHRSWQAETAALAVAEIVALTVSQGGCHPDDVLQMLTSLSPEQEWQNYLAQIGKALDDRVAVEVFAGRLGLVTGVTGYSLHVVVIAVYALLLHAGNFRKALTSALNCGGDTDTVAAILGAMCGSVVDADGIPQEWIDGICDWPRSIGFARRVAERLAEQKHAPVSLGSVRYAWWGAVPRNILFLGVVLFHGIRRIFPPF